MARYWEELQFQQNNVGPNDDRYQIPLTNRELSKDLVLLASLVDKEQQDRATDRLTHRPLENLLVNGTSARMCRQNTMTMNVVFVDHDGIVRAKSQSPLIFGTLGLKKHFWKQAREAKPLFYAGY